MRTTAARTMLLAAALVILVGACSSTSEQVSEQIAEQAQGELDLATPPAVRCPEDAEGGDGESFTCSLELEDDSLEVAVRFRDGTNFAIEVQGSVYEKPVLLDALTEQLAENDIVVTDIDCPGDQLVVISVDEVIDCPATDDEGTNATLRVGLDAEKTAGIRDIVTED